MENLPSWLAKREAGGHQGALTMILALIEAKTKTRKKPGDTTREDEGMGFTSRGTRVACRLRGIVNGRVGGNPATPAERGGGILSGTRARRWGDDAMLSEIQETVDLLGRKGLERAGVGARPSWRGVFEGAPHPARENRSETESGKSILG